MTTLELTSTYVVTECASCHMKFALPEPFERELRRSHEEFWCPQGHSLVFHGKSDLEKEQDLRRAAERREGYARAAKKAAEDQARAAEYARRAQKAAHTRLKNRIAKGICPCCRRNFSNVREHMVGEHADYLKEHGL